MAIRSFLLHLYVDQFILVSVGRYVRSSFIVLKIISMLQFKIPDLAVSIFISKQVALEATL
jgi:hypothetical protein